MVSPVTGTRPPWAPAREVVLREGCVCSGCGQEDAAERPQGLWGPARGLGWPCRPVRRGGGRREGASSPCPWPAVSEPHPLYPLSARPWAGRRRSQERRCGHGPACQTPPDAFCRVCNQGIRGNLNRKLREVLRFGPVSQNWKIFVNTRVSAGDVFLHKLVLTEFLTGA